MTKFRGDKMKYIVSCICAAALVVGIGFGVSRVNEKPAEQAQIQETTPKTHEIQIDDTAFETENPIVYDALLQLEASWNKLDALEQQGINIGDAKKDAEALMEYVRQTGKKVKVEQVEIPGQTLNSVETVVYSADADKGGQVAAAAGFASLKELVSGGDANQYDADGTEQNAIKHAKWNAAAVIFTKDAAYTKFFTDAHEYGHPANFDNAENFADSEMDLKNNAVGRQIGLRLYPQGKISALQVLNEEIDKAKAGGKLTILK